MEEFSKNIDGIRNMLKDSKAEKYAIVNPELVTLDEYVKGLYLKVLCTVINYQNDPSEMQILYLKRIVNGISIDDTAEECMRKALEISIEDMQEFLSIMGKLNCKYYFAVDGIILSLLGKGNAPGYDYLAEILELLEINKADLEYICMITKSVLQQDSSFYDKAKELVNERVEKLDFAPYIHSYYAGAIVDTDTEKHYSAPDMNLSYNIEYLCNYRERKVVFENVEIEFDFEWTFDGCEEVVFRNCSLLGKGGTIKITSVGTVRFENCRIEKFTNRFTDMNNVNNLYVQNCEIIECGYTCDGDKRGGVLHCYGNEIHEICLMDNKLLNCYIKAERQRYNYGVSGVFIGLDGQYVESLKAENNEFIGCSCINNGNYTMAQIGGFYTENCIASNNRCSGELLRVFENSEYENNR